MYSNMLIYSCRCQFIGNYRDGFVHLLSCSRPHHVIGQTGTSLRLVPVGALKRTPTGLFVRPIIERASTADTFCRAAWSLSRRQQGYAAVVLRSASLWLSVSLSAHYR